MDRYDVEQRQIMRHGTPSDLGARATTEMSAVPQIIQRRVHIVFGSTSGHTEYVVDALIDYLKSIVPGWEVEETMAEKTQPQDLLSGDILLLASSTWNTGGIEGQLNPHMWVLLHDKAKTLDLAGKPCACIGLGDHRYFY